MYKESRDLLKDVGADAVKWAAVFMEIIVNEKQDIDESLMIAWFASAIEAGRTAGQESARRA